MENEGVNLFVRIAPGILENVGILVILAWVLSLFSRGATSFLSHKTEIVSIAIGVVFGLTTVALMFAPVEFGPGLILDARGAPLLLSGVYGGPVAAIVSAGISVTARFMIGGVGASAGIMAVFVFSAFGVAYGIWARKAERQPSLRDLLFLCAAAWLPINLTVFSVPEHLWVPIFVGYMPPYLVANLIGVALLSIMLMRELKRVENERMLAEQIERANAAAESKSRFLAAMSHEIRTPLNGILGIIQLLGREKLPDEVRKKLSVVDGSGQYLLALVNQVLDYARLEGGVDRRAREVFAVTELMERLDKLFQYHAEEKGIRFSSSVVGDRKVQIVGDSAVIQQIIFNLVANAIKFTAKGSVDLIAQVRRVTETSARIEFSVSDTGPGMSAPELQHIFEEFVQGSEGEKLGGSGLGLSIAQRLTDEVGGVLAVDSEIGVGSTFKLQLDVAIAQESEMVADDKQKDTPSQTALKILVAEDNVVNQMVVQGLMEADGHSVTVVENGKLAFEAIRHDPSRFDVVLMDAQMPIMSGVEATRKIRELIPDPKVLPIIAVTANAFEEQRAEYLACGMQSVVVKPIDSDKLRHALMTFTGAGKTSTHDITGYDVEMLASSDEVDIDFSMLDMLKSSIGEERLQELLVKVSDNSERLIGRIEEDTGDITRYAEELHELKGMHANIGLKTVVEKVVALSQNGIAADEAATRMAELKQAVEVSLDRVRERFPQI